MRPLEQAVFAIVGHTDHLERGLDRSTLCDCCANRGIKLMQIPNRKVDISRPHRSPVSRNDRRVLGEEIAHLRQRYNGVPVTSFQKPRERGSRSLDHVADPEDLRVRRPNYQVTWRLRKFEVTNHDRATTEIDADHVRDSDIGAARLHALNTFAF